MNKELKNKIEQFEEFTKNLVNQINSEEDLQDFWEESVDRLNTILNGRGIDLE